MFAASLSFISEYYVYLGFISAGFLVVNSLIGGGNIYILIILSLMRLYLKVLYAYDIRHAICHSNDFVNVLMHMYIPCRAPSFTTPQSPRMNANYYRS